MLKPLPDLIKVTLFRIKTKEEIVAIVDKGVEELIKNHGNINYFPIVTEEELSICGDIFAPTDKGVEYLDVVNGFIVPNPATKEGNMIIQAWALDDLSDTVIEQF